MTYIELLNSFWDSTRFNPSSSNEAMMYFYLLHQCNIRRWINPFEFKTRNLELTLGLTRATISAIRNKLKQRGLIDFGKGVGSGSAIYLICGVDVTDDALAEKLCVQSENTKLNTTLNTTLNTMLNTTLNTNADSSLYIEEKRNKTKESIKKTPSQATVSLFADEEKKASGRKPKKDKESPPPPDFGEVRRYFLLHDADKRLENWEEVCERFYNHFTAVDWIDKNKRRITHWDSRANNWILDEEKRQKEKVTHESQQADRFSERRGTEPGAKSRKGFKGTF